MKNLLACALIAFTLSGCGNEDSGSSANSESNAVKSRAVASTLPSLTPEEQSELEKIKNAGNLAGQIGHEITDNIRLTIATNNFGEKIGCIISVQAHDPEVGPTHPRWNLRVQLGKGIENIVWTVNSLDNNAGEVRLVIGQETYSLAAQTNNEGGRSIELNSRLLDSLLSSGSAKGISGMLGDTEFSQTYDLSGFKRAYKFAAALCM